MLLLLPAATSCDKHFFEYEGDCEVTWSLRLVYDLNLKWADIFPSDVKSQNLPVNLYVFDNDGLFVKQYNISSDVLLSRNCEIELDLPTNRTYQFLAWCGLYNLNADYGSFSVPEPVAGVTTITDMDCLLQTQGNTETGEQISNLQLPFLYHGYLKQYLTDNHDGTHYVENLYLTKDTNHIRVMLQQVSGDISAEDVEVSLTDENGNLNWQNDPIGNTKIEYSPWDINTDILAVGNSGGEIKNYYGVIADLSTSRLMADRINDIFLTVRRKDDGKIIFKVPMIQYSLTEKRYYEKTYNKTMSNQEFLDRQDEYVMTFFINENLDNWLYAVIEILEWREVIHNYENKN